jgi:hypothetical protein
MEMPHDGPAVNLSHDFVVSLVRKARIAHDFNFDPADMTHAFPRQLSDQFLGEVEFLIVILRQAASQDDQSTICRTVGGDDWCMPNVKILAKMARVSRYFCSIATPMFWERLDDLMPLIRSLKGINARGLSPAVRSWIAIRRVLFCSFASRSAKMP